MEKSVIDHGQPEHAIITTCAYCGVGCSFRAEMKGEQVIRMVPHKDGKANHGHSCVKGRFAFGYATHKDRITKPMIRKSIQDAWQEVSWEEAIAYAASELKRIQAIHGKDSIGGITSSRCTNEETYLVQKLIRAGFGNNNVDTCARVCHSPTGYGLKKTFGEASGTQDFDSVMDSALINALAYVIITENLVDEAFVQARCDVASFEKWSKFIAQERHSPEASESITGVPAAELRAAARLYATEKNGAIYYGLGVTEHSQGSTMVIGIANLAMATGNLGRSGVGVNPLRGQNNVQGSCDMGSFPHEFPGYRNVADVATRTLFEDAWQTPLSGAPGLRIPNMFDAALDGSFLGLYCEGEDIAQSDPDIKHVHAALRAMECVIVQDIFLNETAKFAHVFLPGSSFLEKDGTFTNAERRISPVRKVMRPLAGYADWEVTQMLSNALGYPMNYTHPSEIMDEIASLKPSFTNVSYAKIDEMGSVQWPCNDEAPEGTPIMHTENFLRDNGKGLFMLTEYVATAEKITQMFPLILTTGRILSQYNVGAQTRRTENNAWHSEDRLEIHPHDAEDRGVVTGDWVGIKSRAGETVLRALITDRVQPGVVYTTFHFPESGANVITTDNSDWATNCPEYKVTAVQIAKVMHPSEWQQNYADFSEQQLELLGTGQQNA